jgi:hypothetical protein
MRAVFHAGPDVSHPERFRKSAATQAAEPYRVLIMRSVFVLIDCRGEA